jgi:hypothetical protein
VYDTFNVLKNGLEITHTGLPRVLYHLWRTLDLSAVQPRDTRTEYLLDCVEREMGLLQLETQIKTGILASLSKHTCSGFQKMNGILYSAEFWALEVEQLEDLQKDEEYLKALQVFQEEATNSNWLMRDVVDKVVKPETQSKGAGWALLHNRDDPKTAKHMISHAWDEDFEEFVGALKKERDIGNISGPVWICAFGL